MALFKIFKGTSASLNSSNNLTGVDTANQTTAQRHEGYAYLTTDDHKLHIDINTTDRITLNADVADRVLYGSCSTIATTVDKIASLTTNTVPKIDNGTLVYITFLATNTAANPTLTIANVKAPIKFYNAIAPGSTAATSWPANSIVGFLYTNASGSYAWTIVSINTYVHKL